jgi:dihydropteroate synthase
MTIEKLSNSTNIKELLKNIGVDDGGVSILSKKAKTHFIYIKDLHVGGANILKQDALSIGADLAVPRGTVLALTPKVDVLLIATTSQLQKLSKKELSQPFGLKDIAIYLQNILKSKKYNDIKIMGVINANDDSFYKSSRFMDKDAIDMIEKMCEDGADIIDIGAVSSKPNAKIIPVDEEIQRIKPILQSIKDTKLYEKVRFSCDSYEPEVIRLALEAGFSIVNDITGLENDEICRLCAQYNATAIIMHMQGTPQTMQDNPKYDNILDDVYRFLEQRVQKAESFGVRDIILDVGIGFGKTLDDNLSLISNLEHFKGLNKELLIGASRKSMIDKISPSDTVDRLAGTLTLHLEALRNGATLLRVHDVFEHKQAIRVQKLLNGVYI